MTRELQRNGDASAGSATLRHCVLDIDRCVCDKADTQSSDDTPPGRSTHHPRGGVTRNRLITEAALAALTSALCDTADERRLLQTAWDHVADGGIIIWHGGELVLTWPDGGASRRIANGHWG